MDSSREESTKKCFCSRCFMPVDPNDRVEVDGQNFHKICSMCCICRKTPSTLKMFYGHVFCEDCFKAHVMAHFKGETPKVHTSQWWMQWGPTAKAQAATDEDQKESSNDEESPRKRCYCTRCLQPVDDKERVVAGGQCFHSHCARCYCCQQIPKSDIKVYYGQVFCEECFDKNVIGRHRDNPEQFFKSCFDQWQNNPNFSDCMKDFMKSGRNTPFVFMMPPEADKCRCGAGGSEWFPAGEPKKCA